MQSFACSALGMMPALITRGRSTRRCFQASLPLSRPQLRDTRPGWDTNMTHGYDYVCSFAWPKVHLSSHTCPGFAQGSWTYGALRGFRSW
jgi:hypothetical protein